MVVRMFALRSPRSVLLVAPALFAFACGDDGRGDSESASGSVSNMTSISGISAGTEVPTEGGGISISGGTSDKLDLPPDSTDSGPGNGGDCNGNGMDNDYEFSVIWIANSGEGTVSKIDTESATEIARYRTGATDLADPSRTSVSLRGDVAIANRSGSITKIANNPKNCADKDASGAIDTSQGPGDVRPWGEDECVMWHHQLEFPQGLDSNQGGPRAVAWDAGDEAQCYTGARLWIGWRDQPNTGVKLRRLNGDTGAIEATLDVPDWTCNWGHGTYGGAIDKDGAFWGLGTLQTLVRVDPGTLAIDRYEGPGGVVYGIAIDKHGFPWLGGWDGTLWRFDRNTATFENRGVPGPTRLRGLAIDKKGHAWIAGNEPCALVQYDTNNNQVVNGNIALPGCSEPVGVSIDRDGFVWVVDRAANQAYKVDPAAYGTVIVGGLVAPYTYSDMTGAGLDLVINPPVD
jgi:hypothetical protein